MDNSQELYHYGVKGMKWGVRRAQKFSNKAKTARESAKEWEEIGAAKAGKLRAKGRHERADKVESKYKGYAKYDRVDAQNYDNRAAREKRKAKFQGKQAEIGRSRSTGAKLATNILAGPFANRTYNSVIAAGGTKTAARVATAVTAAVGGPLGHVVVASLYTSAAGDRKTKRDF